MDFTHVEVMEWSYPEGRFPAVALKLRSMPLNPDGFGVQAHNPDCGARWLVSAESVMGAPAALAEANRKIARLEENTKALDKMAGERIAYLESVISQLVQEKSEGSSDD